MTQDRTTAAETTTVSSADSPHFAQAMRMFNRLLIQSSFAEAYMWAHQAEQIGLATDAQALMPEVNEAYAQLILTCTRDGRKLALRCGNVLESHVDQLEVVLDALDSLIERIKSTDKQIPYAVALTAQGFAQQLQTRVRSHVENQTLLTSGQLLNELLEGLDNIDEYVARLTRAGAEIEPSLAEKLTMARTAISNAGFELNWLLGSNWDKAEAFCRHSLILLTGEKDPSKQTASTGNAVADHIVSQLPAICQSLKSEKYRDSKRRLTALSKTLEAAA